jgi:hypothetical protein
VPAADTARQEVAMAGPLSSPQGLRVETVGDIDYDDANERLVRRTRIVAIRADGTPIYSIIRGVLSSPAGLKIGLNLQSRHDMPTTAHGLAVIRWAVADASASVPMAFAPLTEVRTITQELRAAFDCDGKWFGFAIPQVSPPPSSPVLYFELEVRRFKLKYPWDMYTAHIVAVEGQATFQDHFVLGLSVFTKGRNNGGVNFETTAVAFPP